MMMMIMEIWGDRSASACEAVGGERGMIQCGKVWLDYEIDYRTLSGCRPRKKLLGCK